MARKKKLVAAATEAALPRIPSKWLDQVVTGPMTQEAVGRVMMGFNTADQFAMCAAASLCWTARD